MSLPSGSGGHDASHEDAAAYVLGALTVEEQERFALHLEGCDVCREEVAHLQVVADALPLAAPQLNAPPELKQRVMSAVGDDAGEHDAREAREVREVRATADTRRAGDRVAGSRGGSLRWPRHARRGQPRRWTVGAVGALAALAVALAVVALVGSGSGSGAGAGTRVVSAQVLAHGASATLRITGGRGELLVNGMPQVPPRHTYQVWVQRSGAPQPTDALFSVNGSGGATVAVPGAISGVTAVLVTAEPLGGSRAPTSAPVIVARLG